MIKKLDQEIIIGRIFKFNNYNEFVNNMFGMDEYLKKGYYKTKHDNRTDYSRKLQRLIDLIGTKELSRSLGISQRQIERYVTTGKQKRNIENANPNIKRLITRYYNIAYDSEQIEKPKSDIDINIKKKLIGNKQIKQYGKGFVLNKTEKFNNSSFKINVLNNFGNLTMIKEIRKMYKLIKQHKGKMYNVIFNLYQYDTEPTSSESESLNHKELGIFDIMELIISARLNKKHKSSVLLQPFNIKYLKFVFIY
jgi:hypothetical protein